VCVFYLRDLSFVMTNRKPCYTAGCMYHVRNVR
jgi:hypothetical protein